MKISIESILKNSFYNTNPIIVYAEGCTDGTNEYLESLDIKNVSYEIKPDKWNKKYWGIGGGMNRCVELCDTPHILFTHSDMYHTKNWDKALYDKIVGLGRKHIVSPYRVEPKIFAQGQSTKYGTIVLPKDTFGEFAENFKSNKFEEYAKNFVGDNKNVDIPLAQGVQFMIHVDDWMDNDPIFAPASVEDVDLFIRMNNDGYKFHTLGSSLVFHFGARGSHFPEDDLTKKSQRQIESEQKNITLFVDKWGSPFTTDKWGMFRLNT